MRKKGYEVPKCTKGASKESYEWLRENSVSPLSNVVRILRWLVDPVFQFIRLGNERLKEAIQVFLGELCSYSTLNFIEMYKNTPPLFDAPPGDLATFYMDVPTSFDARIELLNFQFHGIHEEVLDFVNNLYSLLERTDPKKKMHRNWGTVVRRILVCNEPNCESCAFDTVKKSFGGDVDTVAVKYPADQNISRTPVLVLSDNEVFPSDDALNHHMWCYKWRACPPMKKCDKKIHGMALVLLFDTFVLEEAYVSTRHLDQ
ncbi:hypothetical protein HPB51_027719 [Rhipicephalus microplus]|uniref:Uncharacterized protein n=1 Tax=Rhipicephalus microplus TaxID=6941 RepID=A0A9J6CZJ8_RHIMP|nr:hypothetical protein HPB51_027719 [Rhipicephalus microplus]